MTRRVCTQRHGKHVSVLIVLKNEQTNTMASLRCTFSSNKMACRARQNKQEPLIVAPSCSSYVPSAQLCAQVQRGWSQTVPSHCPNLKPQRRHPVPVRAFETDGGKDPSIEQYVEVKIESVRVSQGLSVVYLRVVGSDGVIPVHIGENESNALLREINKQKQVRPLTHDLMRNMLRDLGCRVTKVRITDIVANTYYARVHIAGPGSSHSSSSSSSSSSGEAETEKETEVDARPSDAINLAVRFGAPVYINKKIAESAAPAPPEHHMQASSHNETHAEIVRSVRETLSSYEDPTIMFQLQKELAVKEERFEDAQQFQESIVHEMTHNRLLRLVVAMESALADGRYEEAAHLRDEYRKVVQQSQTADRKL